MRCRTGRPNGGWGSVLHPLRMFRMQRLRAGAIAQAAHELVASQQSTMQAKVEDLTSDDGLGVWLLWRWHGSRREPIARDANVVRAALAAHRSSPMPRRRGAHIPPRDRPLASFRFSPRAIADRSAS